MSRDEELLLSALSALEYHRAQTRPIDKTDETIDALRKRLGLQPSDPTITDCRDCPYAVGHLAQGECWTECSHERHGRAYYQNILWGCQERFSRTPSWCPLGLGR